MRNYFFFAIVALLAVSANASTQFHCDCIVETPEGPKSCCPPATVITTLPTIKPTTTKTTKTKSTKTVTVITTLPTFKPTTTKTTKTLITRTIGPICDCIVLTPTGPKSCCPPETVSETKTKTKTTTTTKSSKTTKTKTTSTKGFSATCDCIRLTPTGPVSCCGGPVVANPTSTA